MQQCLSCFFVLRVITFDQSDRLGKDADVGVEYTLFKIVQCELAAFFDSTLTLWGLTRHTVVTTCNTGGYKASVVMIVLGSFWLPVGFDFIGHEKK